MFLLFGDISIFFYVVVAGFVCLLLFFFVFFWRREVSFFCRLFVVVVDRHLVSLSKVHLIPTDSITKKEKNT